MTLDYMCEISHGQAIRPVIFRESLSRSLPCDIARMANAIDIDRIRASIDAAMKRKSYSRRRLATEAGLGQTSIRDLMEKTDNPGIGTLARVAGALELSLTDMLALPGVVLAGEIGAGGEIAFFNDSNDHETVPRPPMITGELLALRVTGESMLPKYEPGDIIYVRREHDGVHPSYVGEYCAVHASDGGTYLKLLSHGASPGRFTLRSLNAADMEDVEVLWASPVLFIMPRRALA